MVECKKRSSILEQGIQWNEMIEIGILWVSLRILFLINIKYGDEIIGSTNCDLMTILILNNQINQTKN
jgi:hypothetical protein